MDADGWDGNEADGLDGDDDNDWQPLACLSALDLECQFPFEVLPFHRIKDIDYPDHEDDAYEIHLQCRIEYEQIHAMVLVRVRPVAMRYSYYPIFEFRDAFVCRQGQIERLDQGMVLFELGGHLWKELEVAIDGLRFVFGNSATCSGARPCIPWLDRFDVRRLNDASLLAEGLPTVCAAVGPGGYPAPLIEQEHVGEGDPADGQGVFFDVRDTTWRELVAFLNDAGVQDNPAGGAPLTFEDGCWRVVAGFEDLPARDVNVTDSYCDWREMIAPPSWIVYDPHGLRCASENPSYNRLYP